MDEPKVWSALVNPLGRLKSVVEVIDFEDKQIELVEKSAYDALKAELARANETSEVRRLHLYETTKETSRLSLLAVSDRALLSRWLHYQEIELDHSCVVELHSLISETRAALDGESK